MEGPWTILELAELAAGTLAASRTAGSGDADTPDGLDNAGTSARSDDADTPDGLDNAGTSDGSDDAGTRTGSDDAGTRTGSVDAGTPGGPEGAGARAVPVRANGRVRDVPNERLVRWYVTVGLVDPPLSRRGRVARYGRRHLLQLVAVKRRQAEGRSLAEIQAELAGATDETLAAIARVPDAVLAPETPTAEAPPVEAAPTPTRFWARHTRQPAEPTPAEWPGGLVHGVRLALGVTLLLESADREPGPDDVTEIVRAAQPLLAELASRRLCASGPGVLPHVPDRSSGVGSSEGSPT
jgi:DNA-binding transcriptional MerR regulator